jgi:ubiquinone/menaquinone biosynthesis C-methylase UbiE
MKNSMLPEILEQEEKVSKAFSKQSFTFDEADTKNAILQWMRWRVRKHAINLWKRGDHILELNAGTGIDAVFFAENGFNVHATDNAPGMIDFLKKKIAKGGLEDKITIQGCSYMELGEVENRIFDHIFSNFGGLNCTDKLEVVINSFDRLLKPGGTVTLVIMPPICPWELMYLFQGNFKLAFRRLKGKGTPSHLEGVNFLTWYYSPSVIKKMFGKKYSNFLVTGLGIIVPPPFLSDFPQKYPQLFKKLTSIENNVATKSPFNSWADHFIISAKKLE